jgi:hypothetical protein
VRAHPALRIPAPSVLPGLTYAVDVELVDTGERRTVTVRSQMPGAATDRACAEVRATGYRGPIVTHGYREV